MPKIPVVDCLQIDVTRCGGYTGFRVMTDTYLSDAQTRRYRFLLRFEPSGASSADLTRWQQTATAMLEPPASSST